MSDARPPLKWHQYVSLAIILPLVVLAVWTLFDPEPVVGWLFVTSGLFMLALAYDFYGRLALGRARLLLVGLGIVVAAIQFSNGLYLLADGASEPISSRKQTDGTQPALRD